MRPEARLKCGFYPAPPDAVQHIAQYLAAPADDLRFAILDPCAGQGDAIHQLVTALDCDLRDVYAVELDAGRAATLHGLLDAGGAHVLAPASYFGVSAPAGTFSLVWCNPPFDDEYGGGGRVEREFLETATRHLRPRGILALVCPRNVAQRWDVRAVLKSWYDQVCVIPFPDHCRKYNEVVVLGVKRAKLEAEYNRRDADVFLADPIVYQIPPGHGPGSRFVKFQMTDEELEQAFANSPLPARPPPTPWVTLLSLVTRRRLPQALSMRPETNPLANVLQVRRSLHCGYCRSAR
jgi:predicted RNA methylase